MYIILGGTGHVGSAIAQRLQKGGEMVSIVSRSRKSADKWQQKGIDIAVADVYDTNALHAIFSRGKRLFLLNPPADPSADTVAEERKSLTSILRALDGSGIEKVVALSTYGAQPGECIGDLGVLYEMEQALAAQPIPSSIIRAAYFMSNWDMSLQSAQQEGKVHTFYPPDFKIPMVSPHDIGTFAAQLLVEPVDKTELHYIEGPEPYSSAEVATAFSEALNKSVKTVQTPQEQWIPSLMAVGFSQKGAESMAAMTEITLEQQYKNPDSPIRGTTTLQKYIHQLVKDH